MESLVKSFGLMTKVSVCMITYNHELYIEQAIHGVLSQNFDFDVELVISDDASDDKTQEKIIGIIHKNESKVKIRYFRNIENIGMIKNFSSTLNKCQGKYIALCEGDDYWTDPNKLQKQIDFLEDNQDYGICFHRVNIFNLEGQIVDDFITRKVGETTTAMDLAEGNFIHTPSVVLRNDFIIPEWFENVFLGDWSLYLISVRNRKIKYLNDEMATYRIHSSGVWSLKSNLEKFEGTSKTIDVLINKKNFDFKIQQRLLKYKKSIEPIRKDNFFFNFLSQQIRRIRNYTIQK